MEGATDEVREANRARAPDSHPPGEYRTYEQPGQTKNLRAGGEVVTDPDDTAMFSISNRRLAAT
jgi:hypothetical protein